MEKFYKGKIGLILFLTIAFIALLPIISFATDEEIQIVKKDENKQIIYINGLLKEKYEFAFSNNAEVADKSTLEFQKSALDKAESGNNIAYVDSDLYTKYFENKKDTYIWVKQGETYKLNAKKIELSSAITEEDIETLKNVTETIKVTIGEKTLPKENVDGVEVRRKIGTLVINEKTGTYSYIMVKANNNSEQKSLIELAEKLNKLENTDMFTTLKTYQEFINIYEKLKPEQDDKNWNEVKDYTIQQPNNSKDGEQYIVWIKTGNTVDLQIMTCKDKYEPEYEKQENIIVDIIEVVQTGDNITVVAVVGILSLLTLIVITVKVKKKNAN